MSVRDATNITVYADEIDKKWSKRGKYTSNYNNGLMKHTTLINIIQTR